ncbi:hypothetical protein D3C80_2106980 [compost metagenome]
MVGGCQLKFIFKVGHGPDPAYDDLRILLTDIVRQKVAEAVDFHIRQMSGRLSQKVLTLVHREHRVFA